MTTPALFRLTALAGIASAVVLVFNFLRRAGLVPLCVEACATVDENLQCERATGGLKKRTSIHVRRLSRPEVVIPGSKH